MGDTLVEGAIREQTAAILALAVTIEARRVESTVNAQDNVDRRYSWALERVREDV